MTRALPQVLSRRTMLLAAGAGLIAPCARAQPVKVWLPRSIGATDPQLLYVRRLVSLALELTGMEMALTLVDMEMAQGRSLMELARGDGPLDLIWTMTTRQREASGLLTVRIPIDRGLMGWRVLLVRRSDLPRWRPLQSLDDLRPLLAGQGHDWPDTEILRANGLKVLTSSTHDALFRMLDSGRFDYMPRAIMEVDAELADNRHPQLAVVPDLMLYYPTASYLFVSPRRPDLARLLQAGLEKAVAEGSLQRLHHEHFGAALRAHPVMRERIVHLRNPLLPSDTPLQRRELWLQPGGAG
ncbi:substrate-binding periplasmic protein [Roseateles sp. DXS20W]|uniref:Substrate-binding periplasmic protein n=1 Tax=Pelomonas lactea TaxID=3299030 RepID=A0ABW7GG88_9BURK